VVAASIIQTMESLDPKVPRLSEEQRGDLAAARELLDNEK
jgi:hypothetical protein